MPDLPTFTVTDAQAQRLMRVFGTPAAYREWLRRQITAAVKEFEAKEQERLVREYAASLTPNTTDPMEGV